MSLYSKSSPYYTTPTNNRYLDVMTDRPISKRPDDKVFEITSTYHLRPDLLAYDLYNDSNLWWVFAKRNPNTLKDPLFDFKLGTRIALPTLDTIKQDLGL